MKKVKNYFSHDFGARNDKKLEKVRFKLGLEGVGLYWCIIECLYENDGYLSLEEDIDLLAYQLRVDKNLIVDLIENYDLFKKNKNKFYSQSVLNRLEEISNKSDYLGYASEALHHVVIHTASFQVDAHVGACGVAHALGVDLVAGAQYHALLHHLAHPLVNHGARHAAHLGHLAQRCAGIFGDDVKDS